MGEHWFICDVVLNFAARTSSSVLCHSKFPLCCLSAKTNFAEIYVTKQYGCDQALITVLFYLVNSISNTTHSVSAALKDVQRLEAPEAKTKEKDTPAEAVAKAVTVSISTNAKMQILKDKLK